MRVQRTDAPPVRPRFPREVSMRSRGLIALAFLVGLLLGASVVFLVSDRPTRRAFRVNVDIVLTDTNGREIGSLPPGTTNNALERVPGCARRWLVGLRSGSARDDGRG